MKKTAVAGISRIRREYNIDHLKMAQNLEEKICELVRGYIHLYDATVPDHRDKQHCRNSWEEIASAVGLPVKTVKTSGMPVTTASLRWQRLPCQQLCHL